MTGGIVPLQESIFLQDSDDNTLGAVTVNVTSIG
jgi:hypothetical protein